MKEIVNRAVMEWLLPKLVVSKVKWTADGRLLIGLVCGPHSCGQLRQICDEEFAKLASRIKRVALDTGDGVLDCWWDVLVDCGAGFESPEEGQEEEWVFAFQVKTLPWGRAQSWIAPRRVAFVINGRQMINRGKEP